MPQKIVIRPAVEGDVPAMAAIRALEWQTEEFWTASLGRYLRGTGSPQQALARRSMWVAVEDENVAGFVAGHLTTRYDCDGELQWINVHPDFRGRGIAGALTRTMLDWFRQQNAFRICVNVEPDNAVARSLYAKHGAVVMNDYWMLWTDLRQMSLLSDV